MWRWEDNLSISRRHSFPGRERTLLAPIHVAYDFVHIFTSKLMVLVVGQSVRDHTSQNASDQGLIFSQCCEIYPLGLISFLC